MADRAERELERLRSAVSELSSLNEIASAINSSMSVDKITSIIVDKCLKHTNASQGAIFMLEEEQPEGGGGQFTTFVRKMQDSREDIPFHLNMSLAGWMLKNKRILVINEDDGEHPLASLDFAKLGIRSIVASPLLSKNGLIGVLAIFNKRGEEGFTSNDQRFLGIVGTQCAQALEGARLYVQERKLIAINEELGIAKSIQEGFLPKPELIKHIKHCYGMNIPAKEIGGDFFDIVDRGSDEVFLSIGDVVGKGVPAALLMANTQAVLRSHLHNKTKLDLADLAANLNHLVCQFTNPGQFITGLFGVLDNKNKTFSFVNAGHHMPLIANNGKIIKQTMEPDLVFGVMQGISFKLNEIEVPENSTMLLYTDGVSEAENETEEQFGDDRIDKLLLEAAAEPADKICEKFLEELNIFKGKADQADDITIVVAKT